ncbi:MAG: hypothetical protein ACRET7_11765 [Burkholderiales bacterium]
MNTRDPNTLIKKLNKLSPERVAEVEDFVDFLRTRDGERAVEPTFAKVWENEDDAAYDKL